MCNCTESIKVVIWLSQRKCVIVSSATLWSGLRFKADPEEASSPKSEGMWSGWVRSTPCEVNFGNWQLTFYIWQLTFQTSALHDQSQFTTPCDFISKWQFPNTPIFLCSSSVQFIMCIKPIHLPVDLCPNTLTTPLEIPSRTVWLVVYISFITCGAFGDNTNIGRLFNPLSGSIWHSIWGPSFQTHTHTHTKRTVLTNLGWQRVRPSPSPEHTDTKQADQLSHFGHNRWVVSEEMQPRRVTAAGRLLTSESHQLSSF